MPRKTDGMPFELYPRPTKDKDRKPFLYVRPAKNIKRTMKDVEGYCSFRGMNGGLMTLAFENFIDVCGEWLSQGYRIETPFGVFSAKLKLNGDFSDPSKVKPADVEFAGIELTPSKHFLKAVKYRVNGFRKTTSHVGNEQMHDKALMDEALRKSMVQGFTTISRFQAYSGLTYYSAHRYLARHPHLHQERIGRTYQYFWKD